MRPNLQSDFSRGKKLTIVTTVPETMTSILVGQPRYLNGYFDLSLISSPGSAVKQVELAEAIAIQAVPMERGISPFKDLVSIWNMRNVLSKIRPSIVHSYTPKAGLISMIAAKFCGVPVRVHTFTGLIFPTSTGLKKKILIWVDRLICACATHIVPEGEGVKRDLESYRITRKPLKVIGYGNIAGVDTKYFKDDAPGVEAGQVKLVENLGIGANSTIFCFVGRLNRDKGVSELVEAFNRLPESAHLILVGGLDASAPVSNETLARIESNPRIHALGFLSDIRPALKLADFLVLPSYREGFPNVVLQAGAMGLPVIATDISGCNEAVEPRLNGWLVPPRSVEPLENAMKEAMQSSEDTRAKMGENARTRIKQRFERQQHWQRMQKFYQELLNERVASID